MTDAFVVRSEAGRLAVLTAPRAGATALSLAERDGMGVVVLGRLFHAAEVCRRWGGTPAATRDAARTPSPAAIVLAGLLARGTAILDHLEGEFCLVAWDGRQGTLTALRDPLGGYPLFWTARPDGGVAVATTVAGALDGAEAAIDEEFLADTLVRPVIALSEPPQEACAWRGVRRVVPGTVVTLRLADGQASRRTGWDWAARAVDPGTGEVGALGEIASGLLDAAVRERLDGTVAAHLSGGMDSTSVAILAQDAVAGSAPVLGLSLIYERLDLLSRETRYVEMARAARPALRPVEVPADGLLAYDGIGEPVRLDEPYPGRRTWARDRVLFDRAAAAGARTVLTGEGGDDVFDVAPYHIAADLRAGRLAAAWGSASAIARARGTDPWGLFRHHGLQPALPWLLRPAGRAPVPSWIRSDFARRHDLEDRGRAQWRRLRATHREAGIAAMLAAIQCRTGDPLRWGLAAPRGLWHSHPFLDARVLGFGLGLRLAYRQEPGLQKPILARAMAGRLPAAIAERRGKAHFNEVHYRGLDRNRRAIEALAVHPAVQAPGFLDAGAFAAALRQAALAGGGGAAGFVPFDLALSVMAWLAGGPPEAGQAGSRTARHVAAVPRPATAEA